MARCSGARVGCIIGLVARRWAEAAATAAVRWGPLVVSAVGGAEQLLCTWNLRWAEKPPAGKAAELVPGLGTWWVLR